MPISQHDIASPNVETAPVPVDICADRLKDLKTAIDTQDVDTAREVLRELHYADKAELLNLLDEEGRQELTAMIADSFDKDILPELSTEAALDVVETLGPDKSAEVLTQLETDDAIHVMGELSPETQQDILNVAPAVLREELEEGLSYPEQSAGRLMNKRLICVPEFWSVGQTLGYLRERTDLPENFYVIYITDPKFHPVGRVTLAKVTQSQLDVSIASIMEEDSYAVQTTTDETDVAFQFWKYGLVETPVVNAQGRLVGTITVDDVVDVIHREDEKDLLQAGGVMSQDIQLGVPETLKQRFPWLFINLLTAVLASFVIGLFEHTIDQLVVLAVLMPIIVSMGSNAGTQSVTVTIRALATRQLKPSSYLAAIRKEVVVGLFNGLGFAVIMGVCAYVIYHDARLSIVFALATIITLGIVGLFGALIPLILHRLKVDPAVSSTVFMTTVSDVFGFLIFLGLATLVMM